MAGDTSAAIEPNGPIGPDGPTGYGGHLPNPIAASGTLGDVASLLAGLPTLAIFGVIALASLVLRYRRSKGVERQQLKWFLAAVGFLMVAVVGYAVLVGSPNFWFHALGPAAIAVVVAFSLVVLADLSYPFSGDVAISPDDFKTGTLQQFFASR